MGAVRMQKLFSILLSVAVLGLFFLGCEKFSNPVEGVHSDKGEVSSLAKGGNSSATGGGTTVELGQKSTFTFNAVQHSDGTVNGHMVYQVRGGDIVIHMDIDCL